MRCAVNLAVLHLTGAGQDVNGRICRRSRGAAVKRCLKLVPNRQDVACATPVSVRLEGARPSGGLRGTAA